MILERGGEAGGEGALLLERADPLLQLVPMGDLHVQPPPCAMAAEEEQESKRHGRDRDAADEMQNLELRGSVPCDGEGDLKERGDAEE